MEAKFAIYQTLFALQVGDSCAENELTPLNRDLNNNLLFLSQFQHLHNLNISHRGKIVVLDPVLWAINPTTSDGMSACLP